VESFVWIREPGLVAERRCRTWLLGALIGSGAVSTRKEFGHQTRSAIPRVPWFLRLAIRASTAGIIRHGLAPQGCCQTCRWCASLRGSPQRPPVLWRGKPNDAHPPSDRSPVPQPAGFRAMLPAATIYVVLRPVVSALLAPGAVRSACRGMKGWSH